MFKTVVKIATGLGLIAAFGLASAQDPYQLLRQSGEGFERVTPGRIFTFPEDHYPHEDFKIEWWYLTANLQDERGNAYGVHWTLFRQAMNSENNPGGWQSNQTWMAHTAISTPLSFSYSERFARGGIGQAGVSSHPKGGFSAWMDDWLWRSQGRGPFPAELSAGTDESRFELSLTASDDWILQGENGFSQKSELGQASYYYSQPFVSIEGTLWNGSSEVAVSGKGWLDREWSSQPLAGNQAGWDWISLHLNDGSALMVYQLRHDSGEHYISGSLVRESGEKTYLSAGAVSLIPISNSVLDLKDGARLLPLQWRVLVPGLDIDLTVDALRTNSWLETAFPYWEGPVDVTGSHSGSGYLELTGY